MSRILVVHPYTEVVGPHQVLYGIVRQMHGERYRFSVVVPGESVAAEQFRALGVYVTCIPEVTAFERTANPIHLAGQAARLAVAVAKVWRYIRHQDIHLVHSSTVQCWVGGIAARLARVPSVYHVQDLTQSWPKAVIWLMRSALGLTGDYVLFVSEAALRGLPLPNWTNCKAAVVYNGVDTVEYHPRVSKDEARRDLGLARNQMVVATIGGLEQRKGQEWLVRSCARVRLVYPEVRFLIIGYVPSNRISYYRKLQMLIQEMGVSENVVFLGPRKDVPRLLSAVDLLVQPSLNESFGLAIAEAMSCGVPVVATAVGGLMEVVKDGETGLLVPPADSSALSDAILALLRDESRRQQMGLAGRRRVEQMFDLRRQCDTIASIYDDLLRHNPSGGQHELD